MDFLAQLNYVEVIAVITGFLCVWLYTRQNVWSWPLTIVSATLFLYLFFQSRLYADMGLQGVYILLAVYGWYQWLYGGLDHGGLPVSRLTRKMGFLLLGLIAVGTAVMATLLVRYTNADLAFWDSLTTMMSLVGQWMMARKILENWLLWIVADLLYIGIFVYKGLYLTTGLYVLYLGLAVIGFLAWRKTMPAKEMSVAG